MYYFRSNFHDTQSKSKYSPADFCDASYEALGCSMKSDVPALANKILRAEKRLLLALCPNNKKSCNCTYELCGTDNKKS